MDSAIQELLDNPRDDFLKASDTILKIVNNILNHPNEEKYKRVKLSSKTVENNLLPYNGSLSLLFIMGFEEDGEYLSLPKNADLAKLKEAKDSIEKHIKDNQSNLESSNSEASGSAKTVNKIKSDTQNIATKWSKWVFPVPSANIQITEAQFFMKLKSAFDHVLCYEDAQLQKKAQECIPRDYLMNNAKRKYRQASETNTTFDLDDFYIIELMDWYRDDFFRWVNTPPCQFCGSETTHAGMGQPNADDIRWGAMRVELYTCKQCRQTTRFPRYNNPSKLLDTRRGRCGEWANTFTLICRASGYEARHVLDWTDHVWTEVFSKSQNRWLHCDPGEKALDKPLLYESGWGKKLTYVIAFSKDDINDVTWRYSANHKELVLRRTLCRENVLLQMIQRLREERQKRMSDSQRCTHHLRLIQEGCGFISNERKEASAGELIGRLTGSTEWREQRGELGRQGNIQSIMYSFKPSVAKLVGNKMSIKYNCATNKYHMGGEMTSLHDWKSAIYECENMVRNVEVDWNMVYLARTKGSDKASITWCIDLSDTDRDVDKIVICVSSATFHSGVLLWSLRGDNGFTHEIKANTECTIDSVGGCKLFRITADLSGGDGDNAWQHTQLFRQSRDATESSMSIDIYMK